MADPRRSASDTRRTTSLKLLWSPRRSLGGTTPAGAPRSAVRRLLVAGHLDTFGEAHDLVVGPVQRRWHLKLDPAARVVLEGADDDAFGVQHVAGVLADGPRRAAGRACRIARLRHHDQLADEGRRLLVR